MDDNQNGSTALEELALKFLRTATQVQGQVDSKLGEHDLSLQQLKVLSVLQKCEGRKAQVSFIRRQMIDPNSNVSRLLNKLMDKGLIDKERDETDQRVVHIHLTDKGFAAMGTGHQIMVQEFGLFKNLSATERSQLDHILTKLI